MKHEPTAGVFKTLDTITLQDDPIEPSWVLEGQPHARSGCHSTNTDGWAATHVWACSAGRFRWYFGVEETVLILDGEVQVTDAQGRTQRLVPGVVAYFPSGTWWEWHVPQHVRKLSFNRRSVLAPARLLSRALGLMLRPFRRGPPPGPAAVSG
jgi:uncharacterized cupin superfamily protein